MAVREQGAKARLCVLHFGEELFATVGAAKHGYDALNMHNAFRKISRREGDVAEKGQWRQVVELRLHSTVELNLQGDRGVVHRKVKGGGKQLDVRSQRFDSCETGDKFLPQRPLANCAYHNRSFTSKAAMCACMSVTGVSLP